MIETELLIIIALYVIAIIGGSTIGIFLVKLLQELRGGFWVKICIFCQKRIWWFQRTSWIIEDVQGETMHTYGHVDCIISERLAMMGGSE